MYRHGFTWALLFGVFTLMFLQIPPMVARQDSVLTTYQALVEVDALAKQKYVESIDDERLVEGAIRGMMLRLDPYSGYIPPKELPAFERRNHGEFSGVGVEIGLQGGRITVIAPIEGSSAAAAGVLAGDILLSIDGNSLEDRSVFDVEEMLIGAPGSRVRMDVLRAGHESRMTLQVIREPVTLKSVRGFRRLTSGAWDYLIDRERRIGYVRVSCFRDNTMHDFNVALDELHSGGIAALILDLRFNPGGVMPQAIEMVDRFVDDGLLLSTVTRTRAVESYHATPDTQADDVPLVVLINGSSASAAEIVAGSLQARSRALIIGERSFGKGSLQHLIPLQSHKSAIKLTVAHYRLPDGRIIHRTENNAHSDAWGILPDVEVDLKDEDILAVQSARQALDAGDPKVTEVPLDRQLEAALFAARRACKF